MAETGRVRAASGPDDIAAARALFLAYAESLDVDLCFQGFDAEMARFPGEYQPPEGALFVAEAGGEIVGVAGLRPAPGGYAEMKRLYLTDGAGGLTSKGELVVAPGEAVTMQPDGIHEVRALDGQPLLHLHLYAKTFARQGERWKYDPARGTAERFTLDELGSIRDAR